MSVRRRRAASVGIVAFAVIAFGGLGAGVASAHPLGNFTVNHLNALQFETGRLVDEAVVDAAEIPTAQAASAVDVDGDGTASADELAAYGRARCADMNRSLSLTIDGVATPFVVVRSDFAYVPGQAGLDVSRLECRFEAEADFSVARTVEFSDGFESKRIGWHEITADGDGVQLIDPSVPSESISNGLRNYPVDLLSSPLDVRSAAFNVAPGEAAGSNAGDAGAAPARINVSTPGPLSSFVDGVNRRFNDLIGQRDLTLGVGLLAIGLALVLGASHALLPGHGKTVMAAYIAGRQGSVRDAVLVGATVTGTHTGGVLLLGLALTLSTSLAGESVIGWLGVASGLLVAGLGLTLLISAVRHRGTGAGGHGHRHSYEFGHGHSHDDGHSHDNGHSHDDGHSHPRRTHAFVRAPQRGTALATAQVDLLERDSVAEVDDVVQAPAYVAPEPVTPRHFSRRGLIGMGIAGGLVPSPSALVILLSAIALGRTAFGILLVVGYGLGMAATLTAAGVLLVKVRDRYQQRESTSSGRARAAALMWGKVMPFTTAALVLIVGAGLAIRGLDMI